MTLENEINYEQVIEMIKEGIYFVIENDDMGSYDNLNILISNEQFFVRQREEDNLSPNTLYIVVKFGSAAVDYGVTVLPLTIKVVSEQNKCELAQRLLQTFTTIANMDTNDEGTIQQFYESPVVSSNFNEMFEGFRSVIQVSGQFVMSERANPFTLTWYNPATYIDGQGNEQIKGWEDVYFVNGDIDDNFQLDPKLFYESNNFTESINTMGSVTFNISSILLKDNGFYDEMLKFLTKKRGYEIDLDPASDTYMQKVYLAKDERETITIIENDEEREVANPDYMQRTIEITDAVNINKDIILKLTFKNGQELIDIFKIANIHIQQVLKKIPMITFVFSN